MGKVCLEHHIVRADLVNEATQRGVLERIAGVHVTREVLRRQQVELRTLFPDVITVELIVHCLEHEWDPANAALDRDKLDIWITGEYAGHDQIANLATVLEQEIDCYRGVSG